MSASWENSTTVSASVPLSELELSGSKSSVGGIAGSVRVDQSRYYSGLVRNNEFSGKISANTYVGGMVGNSREMSMINNKVTGEIYANDHYGYLGGYFEPNPFEIYVWWTNDETSRDFLPTTFDSISFDRAWGNYNINTDNSGGLYEFYGTR